MIEQVCGNKKVWRCDKWGCGRRVAQYTTLGGWTHLKTYVSVECGTPQMDAGYNKVFCPACWEKVKDEHVRMFRLTDKDIRVVKKEKI
jgi:hypothetical protein